MPAQFPGQFNTYVPNTESSKNLVADFSRNPEDFALPQYVQYIPVDKNKGFYTEMTVEMAGRIVNPHDSRWADGDYQPRLTGSTEKFEFKPYQAQRHIYGFEIGEMAADQASWDILAQLARHAAQRAMTNRTLDLITFASNTSNYLSASHVFNVASAPITLAGRLDAALSTNMDIKKTLDYCAEFIHIQTLGAVTQDQIMFVMNPTTARALSNTQELRDTVKQSPMAQQLIEAQLGPWTQWGLPGELYGYKIIIENTVRVSTKKGATTSKDFVLGDGNILVMSRPGGLEGVEGAPSFSSYTAFIKDEMIVEQKHDQDNKLYTGRVIDTFDFRQTAPLASMIITNALT
jgi:hypothetical protein